MAQWNMGSAPDPNTGIRDIEMNVSAGDDGAISGTVIFQTVKYAVTGQWAASGSEPGRNASAFFLGGGNGEPAPDFIAVAGIMVGPGTLPQSISLNLIRTDTTDGLQYGYDGQLTRMT